MDLDLAEYDQIDEIKHLMGPGREHCFLEGSSAKFCVTLSSSPEPSCNLDESPSLETDFVFVPSPLPAPTTQKFLSSPTAAYSTSSASCVQRGSPIQAGARQVDSSQVSSSNTTNSANPPALVSTGLSICTNSSSSFESPKLTHNVVVADRVDSIRLLPNNLGQTFAQNDQSGRRTTTPATEATENRPKANPFVSQPISSSPRTLGGPYIIKQPSSSPLSRSPMDAYLSNVKPIGLIENSAATSASDPAKLSELMQQVVTRSDLIYLAIPCTLCAEQIACPPSDLGAWLGHMYRQHNCRVCPICNQLVGLGPVKDLQVMRQHVVEHIDDTWLDRKPVARFGFTFGLQQQWFSGSRCSVRMPDSHR